MEIAKGLGGMGVCRTVGLYRTRGIGTGKRLLGPFVPHLLGPLGLQVGRNPWEKEVQTNSSSERESSTVWGSRTGLEGSGAQSPLEPMECAAF